MSYTTTSAVYIAGGLSSDDVSTSDVTQLITWADAIIDARTGVNYASSADYEEVFNVLNLNEFNTVRYITGDIVWNDEYNYFFIERKPVNNINHFYILDNNPTFSKVFSYDLSTTTYTDNTSEANTPRGTSFYAFSETVGVGDVLYFGSGNKFTGVVLNLVNVGVGGVVVWEYYNGTDWTAMTVSESSTGCDDLNASGVISWDLPSGMGKTTINDEENYYVRVRVTTAHSTSPSVDYFGFKQDSSIVSEVSINGYNFEDYGIVKIHKSYLEQGENKVKISYNSGSSTVPSIVEQLSTTIAAISAAGSIIGKTYDEITRGTLGDMDYGVGEQYINLKNSIMELKKKEEMLWKLMPRKALYGDV